VPPEGFLLPCEALLRAVVCDRPLADTMAEAAHEQEALFDRDDFDAVDYVNQLFPTGAVSTSSVDAHALSLLCSPEERRVAW
jgi:hypothetical protein